MCKSACTIYLQRCKDAGGDDDEKPEIHVEELADHVGHVSREYKQKQAQTDCTEVFPQAPAKRKKVHFNVEEKRKSITNRITDWQGINKNS